MIDSQSAVQLAIFSALEGATAVTDLADVWQNPPENTQPGAKGLVLIGLVSLSADLVKGNDYDKATVSVFTQVRKPDATKLYALSAAVRGALDGQAITATGADISKPVFLSADAHLMDDGATYENDLQFEMYVQPA